MKSFKLHKMAIGAKDYGISLGIYDSGDNLCQSLSFDMGELKLLMRTIQEYLPMEVCESSDLKMINNYAQSIGITVDKHQADIHHLNARLRTAEAKIVSLENDLSGHAGEHMKNNLVDKVRSLEIKVARWEQQNHCYCDAPLKDRVKCLESNYDKVRDALSDLADRL